MARRRWRRFEPRYTWHAALAEVLVTAEADVIDPTALQASRPYAAAAPRAELEALLTGVARARGEPPGDLLERVSRFVGKHGAVPDKRAVAGLSDKQVPVVRDRLQRLQEEAGAGAARAGWSAGDDSVAPRPAAGIVRQVRQGVRRGLTREEAGAR